MLHFVLAFVGLRRRLRWLLWAAYAGFGALSLVSFGAFFGGWPAWFVRSSAWSVVHLARLPLLAAAIWVVTRHLRRQTSARRRYGPLVLAALAIGGLLPPRSSGGSGPTRAGLGPLGRGDRESPRRGGAPVSAVRENLSVLAAVDAAAIGCVALLATGRVPVPAASTAALVGSSVHPGCCRLVAWRRQPRPGPAHADGALALLGEILGATGAPI